MDEQALIDRYIAVDPYDHGPQDARLKDSGTPVWALIGYLEGASGDVARVAADYEIPLEAVQAAVAYYHRHRAPIDAKLLLSAV
jgi:uncharacterized protein (DUF433 family)